MVGDTASRISTEALRTTEHHLDIMALRASSLWVPVAFIILSVTAFAAPSTLQCFDERELLVLEKLLYKEARKLNEYKRAVKCLQTRLAKAKGNGAQICLTDDSLSATLVQCAIDTDDLRIPGGVIRASFRTASPEVGGMVHLDLTTTRAGKRVFVTEAPVRVVAPSKDPSSISYLLPNIAERPEGPDRSLSRAASANDNPAQWPSLSVNLRFDADEGTWSFTHPQLDTQPPPADHSLLETASSRTAHRRDSHSRSMKSLYYQQAAGEPLHYRERVFTKILDCGRGFPCCVFAGSFPRRERVCFALWCQQNDGCH